MKNKRSQKKFKENAAKQEITSASASWFSNFPHGCTLTVFKWDKYTIGSYSYYPTLGISQWKTTPNPLQIKSKLEMWSFNFKTMGKGILSK